MGTEGGRVQDGGSGASWVFSSMAKVNSGFQSVVDSVWHWGRAPYFFPMDTLHTLLFGWLIFGVLVVLLAKFLYDKFLSGDNDIDEYSQNNFDDPNAPKLPTGGCLGPPPKISRKATIVPDGPPERVSPPVATGGDPDAIRWINNLLVWFYEGSEGGPILKDAWNDVLNEYTVGVALETGVLVEVLEFLPQSPPPQLTNIVVDCSPTDDMTITCDVEQILYLRVQTTRTQRDVTTESEYACAVRPLRGRLNIAVQTHKCRAHAKLDGWPDVTIILEGVRNNATGLDEQQLQDVLTEVLSSAIRMVCLDIDFTQKRTFPRFSRVRSVPDRVMPVGYDALVREAQTHPPSFTPKAPFLRNTGMSVINSSKDVNVVKAAMGIPSSSMGIPASGNVAPINAITAITAPMSKHFKLPLMEMSSGWSSSFTDEDHLEEAGESFSAMNYSSSERPRSEEMPITPHFLTNGSMPSPNSALSPSGFLSPSEESLIARNLERYGKSNVVSDIDYPQVHAKHSVRDDDPSPIRDNRGDNRGDNSADSFYVTNSHSAIQELSNPPSNRSSMVFSSREKPIDEYEINESVTDEDDSCLEELNSFSSERPPLKGALKHATEKRPKSPLEVPSRSPRSSFRNEMEKLKDSLLNNSNNQHPPLGKATTPFNRSTSSATPVGIVGLNGKRLLVKVVKASGIGGDKDVSLSYAVIEMDEPPQKFTTASVSDTSSPFWDEQFLFDLSDNTLELLFEIYDKKDKRFLGLGIVGIEELVATPSQRQIIPLQSRPCENDKVSGSLTCEFLFLDRADLPDLTFRTASGSNQGSNRFKVSSTSHDKPNEGEYYDEGITLSKDSDPVSWKEVEGRHTKPVPSTKSTMVVHSSRKPMNDERPEIPSGDSLEEEEMWVPSLIAPVVPQLTTSGATGYTSSSDHNAATGKTSTASNVEDKSLLTTNDTDDRGRSRNRSNKRDFFGSLRRRFSRSKLRSKSVDPTGVVADTTPDVRSVSVERSSSVVRPRGLLTVPTGMRKSSTGNFGGDSGSTRSSLSGTSGLSSASTRTFINEASLLVVETLENGIIKHYLVPLALQRKNKWRKKGTKLHIYNEHTFVAKHLSSSVLCHVCNKTLGRRLGKQGYECRDCSFKCHKPCHIKTDIVCPNSTVNSMDLVYVKDEKAERKKALRIS